MRNGDRIIRERHRQRAELGFVGSVQWIDENKAEQRGEEGEPTNAQWQLHR